MQCVQLAPGLRIAGFGGSVPAFFADGSQAWEGFPYTESDIQKGVSRALAVPPLPIRLLPGLTDGLGPTSYAVLPKMATVLTPYAPQSELKAAAPTDSAEIDIDTAAAVVPPSADGARTACAGPRCHVC